MLTIPSGIDDPSYRYKMPKMVLKQESRLNGVKTNITNIEDVASALRVPSISIMKYLSSELGANMEQTSIIKGDHPYSIMLKQLDKFIEKYICCRGCKYPELQHVIEGKDLKSKCNSCGKTNSHDAMHKAGKALFNHVKAGKG
jgi:translation initiation factor 5